MATIRHGRRSVTASGRAGRRGRGERGGAVSLWVVLMVPVSAFAAVVAMAGPQRLAAESTMQDAADDLATFAVVWRDGHQIQEGPLLAFPIECEAETEQQQTAIAALGVQIDALQSGDPISAQQAELDRLLGEFNLPAPAPAADEAALERQFRDLLVGQLEDWEEICVQMRDALVRDLGYLGMDMGSLRGAYTDALTTSAPGNCSDPAHTTEPDCTGAGETWSSVVPCKTSEQMVVRDAVHVVLAADWQDAGWAAAQVWPDGLPMAAESTSRLSQRNSVVTPLLDPCGEELAVLDSRGDPVWSGTNPTPPSRTLVQSTRRSALSG